MNFCQKNPATSKALPQKSTDANDSDKPFICVACAGCLWLCRKTASPMMRCGFVGCGSELGNSIEQLFRSYLARTPPHVHVMTVQTAQPPVSVSADFRPYHMARPKAMLVDGELTCGSTIFDQ